MPFNPERELLCSLIACGGQRKGMKWAKKYEVHLFRMIDQSYIQVYGKSYEEGDFIITQLGRDYFDSLIEQTRHDMKGNTYNAAT